MFTSLEETLADIPETRDSLLLRVKDPRDREAWEEFSRIYRPVAYRLARARGMQDADAEELAQQVLVAVSKAIASWERESPDVRFRHWLLRVAKNAVVNALTRRPKDRAQGGNLAIELHDLEAVGAVEPSDEIDLEYRRQLFRRAAEIVRSRADEITWQAFWLTAVEGLPVAGVALQLERSEGMVYAARSRIIRRLRNAIQALESD